MLTVAILLNGEPLMARSAVKIGHPSDGLTMYRVDDGTIIYHDRKDGALVLAKKLLDTIVGGD